jgi:hypothetical protein
MLTSMSTSYGRGVAMTSRYGMRPQPERVRAALRAQHDAHFDTLERMASERIDIYDEEQFELALAVLLAGIAQVLLKDRRPRLL